MILAECGLHVTYYCFTNTVKVLAKELTDIDSTNAAMIF